MLIPKEKANGNISYDDNDIGLMQTPEGWDTTKWRRIGNRLRVMTSMSNKQK